MFEGAESFRHQLCGGAWLISKATKNHMFEGSFGSLSSTMCRSTVFSPQSKTELKSAVADCLNFAPEGDCAHGPHGPIGKWDVSSITDMSYMFKGASSFTHDISEWDVSNCRDMHGMFWSATMFNVDISKWDMRGVIDMDQMFMSAESFKQKLCGKDWLFSGASKNLMFRGSPGSISATVCETHDTAAFSPQSKKELQTAVDACLESSPEGECADGPHGPIGKWDVSSVTDMSSLFMGFAWFDADI